MTTQFFPFNRESQTPIMFQIIEWFNFIIPIDIDPFSNAHIGQNTVHRMVHHLNYNELPPGLVQTVWQKGLKTFQQTYLKRRKKEKIVKWRIIEIGHCDFTKKNIYIYLCLYLKWRANATKRWRIETIFLVWTDSTLHFCWPRCKPRMRLAKPKTTLKKNRIFLVFHDKKSQVGHFSRLWELGMKPIMHLGK